ncbi:hypothetical protein IAQ67_28920 (plasmid) [Paenibacillus peoriae]|uniref:Uncharacterized protein n=1 Tax=Paenibacillus peoriae TaxID=59893 RepID=A0A7H0YHF2_9BACL|nr:hypothetical protein [Paenibacillus peoriae]QNR70510.1 hypothetical protein IAQ67_28920 [Paenibacillus peoriae]
MKFKNTAVILTGVLALTAVAPLAASAAPTSIEVKEVKQATPDAETFSAIKDIEKFIKLDGDQYVLDSAAKEVVSEKVFNNYSKAVESVNEQIKNGTFEVKNGQLVVNPNYTTYNPNIYGNWYWWGYAITFTNQEVKEQVQALKNTQSTSSLVFAIMAAVPGLQGTALPAAIIEANLAVLIDRFEANNHGRGVTLNLHVGYYDMTSN